MESNDQAQLLRQVRLALQNDNYPEAIGALERAASLAHDSGDIAAEGRHLGNMALVYYRIQQPDTALRYFQRALECARADGDRLTEDGILGNMGNILREIGRHNAAIEYLNQALFIAQEIGDVRGRGIWLSNIGLAYDDMQRWKEAIEVHKESVMVARRLHDQRGLAVRLGNLGNSYAAIGDYTSALKCFHEAVSVYRAVGDREAAALRLGIIGNIYNQLGRTAPSPEEAKMCFELAVDSYRDTLALAVELGDRLAEAELMGSLGNALGNLGKYDDAIAHFQVAYNLFDELGLSERLPHLRKNIEMALTYRDGQA